LERLSDRLSGQLVLATVLHAWGGLMSINAGKHKAQTQWRQATEGPLILSELLTALGLRRQRWAIRQQAARQHLDHRSQQVAIG
jgi:hypothetical protein